MHKSKLRNQFLKLHTHESRLRYNKQKSMHNFTMKAKKNYQIDLKMSDINDSKKSCKNVKHILGSKVKENKNDNLGGRK